MVTDPEMETNCSGAFACHSPNPTYKSEAISFKKKKGILIFHLRSRWTERQNVLTEMCQDASSFKSRVSAEPFNNL